AKWLTPKGNYINEVGIEPDVKIELPFYFQVMPMSKTDVLKQDMMNNDVKSLQTMLRGLGYETDRDDGYFSEQTADMVRKYQEERGLPATGEVDQETAAAIEQQLIEKMMNPANDRQL